GSDARDGLRPQGRGALRLHDEPAARGSRPARRPARPPQPRPGPRPRARRALAPGRPPPLRLEEREVGPRPHPHGGGQARLLGTRGLPHAWRSVRGGALRVAAPLLVTPWARPSHRLDRPEGRAIASARIELRARALHSRDATPGRARAGAPDRPR